jgi:hypothetical protein
MFTIVPDHPVTRRQRAHFIIDENGHTIFSAPNLIDCLTWLIDRENYSVEIRGTDRSYQFDLLPI